MSGFNKAHASSISDEEKASAVEKISKFFSDGDIKNNPYSETGFGFDLWGLKPEQLQEIFNGTLKKGMKETSKFDSFMSDIVEMSIDVLSYIYYLITEVIIATPALVFNTAWFSDSYLKFAGISILAFTFMAIYNAGRKTFNLSHTKLRDVVRRYFLAITGIGFATFFFQQFFKIIRFISEVIVSIGYHQIKAVDFTSLSAATTGDTIALALFVLVTIGLATNIVLQNGRRWFQIVFIALTTSFSLSAWVFDSTRSIFSDVKEKFVKLSITQLYYSTMISIMGLFIVGTAGVESILELIIKLAMIAGGLSIMTKPPQILGKYIDKNTETMLNMYENLKKSIDYKLNPAYAYGKKGVFKALGVYDKATQPSLLEKRLKAGRRSVK